ncbi:MAG: hypothetical protein AAGG07_07850 [Planctomycetota bacterium]
MGRNVKRAFGLALVSGMLAGCYGGGAEVSFVSDPPGADVYAIQEIVWADNGREGMLGALKPGGRFHKGTTVLAPSAQTRKRISPEGSYVMVAKRGGQHQVVPVVIEEGSVEKVIRFRLPK